MNLPCRLTWDFSAPQCRKQSDRTVAARDDQCQTQCLELFGLSKAKNRRYFLPRQRSIRALAEWFVDRLDVIDIHGVAVDARIGTQRQRHVTHQPFDKLGLFVGALGDPFAVGPFEQRSNLARGGAFGKAHQFVPFG